MREKIAVAVGFVAVVLYLLGYLQKKRGRIIALNATSRTLYILQYMLLGALEGAVLDVAGLFSSILAQKKQLPFIRRHLRILFVLVNLFIIAMGFSLYKNIFSLFPMIGVLLHTSAFWMDDEKRIRQVSFLGSPFWLTYNFLSEAYGSCVGDILSMVSLGIAMVRYDIRPKIKKESRSDNE